jgi:NhaP-type Na+/H+ or K+/H+ antiporter
VALLLVFALCLLVAVLVSEQAHRTILSTAVLFLVAGVIVGEGVLDVVPLHPEDDIVATLAELALFSVLFTDGMRVGVSDLRSAWRLPGRALLLGLPLTLVGTAALGVAVAGLPWELALLLGAVLSPTDPVFASAIVGREEISSRLRRLLNVESGLNDGLALPVVIILLEVVGDEPLTFGVIAGELALGIAIGVAVPWLAIRLEESRFFSSSTAYEPLNAVAIGLLVLGLGSVTHANLFLAAFAAGVTVATIGPDVRASFHQFGENVAELLKLAALLVLGTLISPSFLAEIPASGYLFAVAALLVVRPVALGIALVGSRLSAPEWAAAAWFGPKGFASVVYALLVLESGVAGADELFHLAALVIAASIVAHSSTDVLVARWLPPDTHASDESSSVASS